MSAACRGLDVTRISERGCSPRSLCADSERAAKRWAGQARLAAKSPFLPAHVRNCANNPKKEGRWTLAFWPKSQPTHQTRTAYTCGSYRCPSPACQRHAAHTDFAKLSGGMERVDRNSENWVFLVLTIDQHGTLCSRASGKPWENEQEAFKALSRNQRNFMSRMRREFAARGWAPPKNWASTVEVQANGWPHVNIMLHSPELARELRDDQQAEIARGVSERVAGRLGGWLQAHAIACDWGSVGYASPAKGSAQQLAGYLVKIGGRLDQSVGEIAKLTQAPRNARMKLRRIRSSKGFFVKREKNESYTGIMLRRKRFVLTLTHDSHGRGLTRKITHEVAPLMQPENVRCPEAEQANYLAGARKAIADEQAQSDREESGAPERLLVDSRRDDSERAQAQKWIKALGGNIGNIGQNAGKTTNSYICDRRLGNKGSGGAESTDRGNAASGCGERKRGTAHNNDHDEDR